MTFKFATSAQVLARVREKYRDAKGQQVCKLAAYMLATFTDAELMTAFELNAGQLNSWKARATAKKNKLDSLNAEVGE